MLNEEEIILQNACTAIESLSISPSSEFFSTLLLIYYKALSEESEKPTLYDVEFICYDSLKKHAYIADVFRQIKSNILCIQRFADKYPHIKRPSAEKIQFIESLTKSFFLFSEQKLSFDLYLENLRKLLVRSVAHETALRLVAEDNAEVIVFSIGSHDNTQEIMPNYTQQFAAGTTSVYNFNVLLPFDVDKIYQDFKTRNLNSVDVKLLDQVTPMPSMYRVDVGTGKDADSTDGLESDVSTGLGYTLRNYSNPVVVNHFKKVDATMDEFLDKYLLALIEKKLQCPNFKFVFQYCCSAFFDARMKQFISDLLSKGFTLGKDLEIVHAYFADSPAIIYRDFDKIPNENQILRIKFSKDIERDYYDAEMDAYVYKDLGSMQNLFTHNPLNIPHDKSVTKP